MVETAPVERKTHRVVVRAMGKVMPARQIALKPRISGELVEVSPEFVPGGTFKRGDIIARIDDSDYLIAEKKAQAALSKATASLDLERAQQEVAKKHYSDFVAAGGKIENEDFVLRKPQGRSAAADLNTAQASLEQARLDLERTTIKSPFDAVLISTSANIGDQVGPQTEIASLADSSCFWIRVSIPKSDLGFISVPDAGDKDGSRAEVAGIGGTLHGRLIEITAELDEDGQMAGAIIEVEDPLSLKAAGPRIFLNQIVAVEIMGMEVRNCARIPRSASREGRIWLLTSEKKLMTMQINAVWNNREWLFFTEEIPGGAELIVSDLPFAVEGMQLRTSEDLAPGVPEPDKAKTKE